MLIDAADGSGNLSNNFEVMIAGIHTFFARYLSHVSYL